MEHESTPAAWRIWAAHLVLAVMLLRALLPAGWMPSATAGAPIVICTVDGLKTISLDDAPGHAPGQDKPQHQDQCAFASAAPLSSPASFELVLVPVFAPVPHVLAHRIAAPSTAPPRGAHASRAPPAFA